MSQGSGNLLIGRTWRLYLNRKRRSIPHQSYCLKKLHIEQSGTGILSCMLWIWEMRRCRNRHKRLRLIDEPWVNRTSVSLVYHRISRNEDRSLTTVFIKRCTMRSSSRLPQIFLLWNHRPQSLSQRTHWVTSLYRSVMLILSPSLMKSLSLKLNSSRSTQTLFSIESMRNTSKWVIHWLRL